MADCEGARADGYPKLSRPFEWMKSEYDVVVVGSGYGAGLAASRMARAGKTVAVIELGRERQRTLLLGFIIFDPGEPDLERRRLIELRERFNRSAAAGKKFPERPEPWALPAHL